MNLYKCDEFHGINNYDNLLNECCEIDLKYRKTLSIPKNQNFGTEIEFLYPINKQEKLYNYINIDTDYTIHEEMACFSFEKNLKPLEISSPILNVSSQKLLGLKEIFKFLYNNGAILNLMCSNHVHFDIKILKDKYKYYDRFLKFFSVYEPIIYMFGCGEISTLRNSISYHAKEIGKDYLITSKYDDNKNIKYLKNKYSMKSHAIRFSAFHTIEIRTAFSTLNPCINQNNIIFFYKIFEYVTSKNYDSKKIDDKFKNINLRSSIIQEYNKFNIDDVMDLADMLYNNNLDKIYFIKQCLKLYTKNDLKYLKLTNTYKK